MARLMRRVAGWAGGTLLLLLLLAAGGLGVLQTEPGKSWLAATLSDIASDASGMAIRIGAIDGSVPGDMTIATLTIADHEGVWLSARALKLDWHPLDLLARRVSVARLAAAELDIARAPVALEAAPPPPDPEPQRLELPRLPLEIAVADVEISEIRLGAGLLGEEIIAAAFGSATLGSDPRDAELALNLLRLDGVPARVELTLAQSRPAGAGADVLTLTADLAEPPGGLVARLLGLPDLPAVALHLAGSGPASGWSGRLDATAGDASAGLDVQLAIAERIDLALAGEVTPGGLAGPELRDLLPGPIALDAALGYTPGARLEIAHADLLAPGLELHLAGALDQATETVAATLRLAADDPAVIARLADPVEAAGFSATARIDGTLTAPSVDIDATLDDMRAPGVSAASLGATATLAPIDGGQSLALSVALAPQGIVLDDDDGRIGALIGDAPAFALDGTLDPASLRLDVSRLDLTTAVLRASGAGHVADEGRDVDLALALRVDDLAPLGAMAGQALSGALDADLHLAGDATAPRLAIDLAARGGDIGLADPLLAAILGSAPQLASSLTLDGDRLTVARADLTTALATAQASGSVGDTLDLTIELAAPSLSSLSTPVGTRLAGAVTMTGRITGPSDDPAVTAHAAGSRMAVAGVALGDPLADVSVAGLAGEPQGKVSLAAAPGGAALRAQTGFRVGPAGGIRLDGLTMAGDGGTRLAGNLALGGDGLMNGVLDGGIADLSAWQRLAGTQLAGAVELRLTATPLGGEQNLVIAATGRDLSAAGAATIATLELDGEIRDALAAPALDLRLAAGDVVTDGLSFDTVQATAQGGLADLGWTLAAAGDESTNGTRGASTAALDAQGRLALDGTRGTLTVASLAASLAALEASLIRPAVLAWGDEGMRVEGVDATIGDGRLSASGRFADGAMALNATLVDLPVKPFSELAGDVILEGRLSGQAALSGDPAAPDGRATLTLTDLREADIDPAEATALGGEASAVFAAGRVDATARLFGPKDLALDAEVSAPLAGEGPLSGAVTGGIDLALIPRIIDLRGDALSGRLDLDLALSGRRDQPQIGGRATIAGGAYESATQGTVLRDLAAEVVGDVNRVRLVSLSANDGAGGRISGTGALTVDADAGFPLEAAITLDRFTALRRADATVQMSGALDVDRAAGGGGIAGRLRVDAAELRIPDRLSGEVVTLEVTEINLPPGRERIVRPPRRPAAPLDLDVEIEVPRRAFLRGRGLESEWQGRLKVGGTTATPDIVGSLSVVRGTLDLLGRIFRFETGNVNFVGGDEIDPELDFVATSEAEALTIHAAVSGTASAPSFELSSEPPLPQDEVLARLLFGSSAGSLTPVQAVQLAQTAASLSGRGGPVSVLDELRQGFGLDMLGVESGETVSSSSLAVGKYLTDDVFVKMNQGVTPESRRVGVEVRVMPRVTVESDIGAESQGSVGVNWKLDY